MNLVRFHDFLPLMNTNDTDLESVSIGVHLWQFSSTHGGIRSPLFCDNFRSLFKATL